MKISVLVVYRDDLDINVLKPPEFYNFITMKKSQFEGTDSFRLTSYLWQANQIKVFYTIGGPISEWLPLFGYFPYQLRKKWIHYNELSEFSHSSISYCLINSNRIRSDEPPLISVMTTTFHSGDKLNRPLESLREQSYNNWEWVIWDDSKDDLTWKELQKLAAGDMRIRIFKAPHSGYIGEMKRRSGALARGDWIVELDHDDRITPDLFQTIADIQKKYPKVGFIYSDFYHLSEGAEDPHVYPYAAFGYGAYFKHFARGKFHNVYYAQSLNPKTAIHIVGVPNHVRIWKRDVYEALNKHCEDLPVVDDYELLLRTFLYDCDWIRIPEPAYAQYNNASGNNFTFIRNKLIQHLSAETWRVYGKDVQEKFRALEYPSKVTDGDEVSWLRVEPDFKRYESTYCKEEISVLLIIPKGTSTSQIYGCLNVIYKQKIPFRLYIVGHPRSPLEEDMEDWAKQHPETLGNLRYWSFLGTDLQIHGPKEIWDKYLTNHYLLNYGLKIGVRTKWVAYMVPGEGRWSENHLEEMLEKVGEKRWYLGEDKSLSNFMHQTDLLEEHGYWNPTDNPEKMIARWK